MKRRRMVRTLALTALGIAYGGVTLGLIAGYDSRSLIDGFRGSIPQPSFHAYRGDGPRAADFWADQGQPKSSAAKTQDGAQ